MNAINKQHDALDETFINNVEVSSEEGQTLLIPMLLDKSCISNMESYLRILAISNSNSRKYRATRTSAFKLTRLLLRFEVIHHADEIKYIHEGIKEQRPI